MLAKKALSFLFVFIAGMVAGVRLIFDDAYDLGEKAAKVNGIIHQKPSWGVINTIVDTMNDLPVLANAIAQLNWGYLQWALLILFFLAVAFIAWPSKKEEGEEKKKSPRFRGVIG